MHFPTFRNRNIALYYFLTFFMNGWFILPNWVFYFAQFISIPQIGLIDGLSKLVAVVLEVPSGAVSDLLGKKKTLIVGNLLLALCCLILINSTTFSLLLAGNIVMFIGFAFISGSKEALLYDSLIDIKKEDCYDEVLGKVNSIAMFMTILSIFIGSLAYRFDPKLTFIIWMIYNLTSLIILFFMSEPKTDTEHISYKVYFSKLKTGAASIFTKPILTFVLPVIFFSMLIKAYEGVIRQNTGALFGFTGETFGYMLTLIYIPTLVVSYHYNKIISFFKNKTEYLFTGLYLLGFLIVYFSRSKLLGVVSFLSIYIAQEIVKPYIAGLINRQTESRHRATAISTVSLFSEFPYMIITIFFGSLITIDNIKYLYAIFALTIVAYSGTRRFSGNKNPHHL